MLLSTIAYDTFVNCLMNLFNFLIYKYKQGTKVNVQGTHLNKFVSVITISIIGSKINSSLIICYFWFITCVLLWLIHFYIHIMSLHLNKMELQNTFIDSFTVYIVRRSLQIINTTLSWNNYIDSWQTCLSTVLKKWL